MGEIPDSLAAIRGLPLREEEKVWEGKRGMGKREERGGKEEG